ncbi:arylsulfatase [Flavihumibacter petaseus]|uniref:Putative sulfatase n=1 Tax=Flavihumibacter petaseus NBRC 106054 TaxID=1220578 RepID=A0A0E9MVC9_9BACT|nr:arylsulfatase [Flavihumibacter petaseus]GAO41090.1 putative sulfatase [Flavihumibacter petaseus NBRC 106054]
MILKRLLAFGLLCLFAVSCATAQQKKPHPKKPNIIMLISDDTGWGDLGVYGGGAGRGMPTPNLDRLAKEGMQFWDFYGQPSCTPGRAAMITGRIPNRSGMTTVAFQGQGGGLPAPEWTLASVLKQANYKTYFSGKWHLGEADYAMPIAHGFDKMQNVVLYHLNAYTYAFQSWNPDMDPQVLAVFKKVTTGILEGEAGGKAREVSKVTEENIAELDNMMTENVLKQLDTYAKGSDPFFMCVNFAKNHQPNLPSKAFKGKSPAGSKYGDCVMEMDHNVGRVMDKVRALGISEKTIVIYTVDNGAWQDVHPDAGYTPFRGSKGTDREGGSRVPAIAWWPGQIKAGSDSHDIVGGLDLMATFASLAGVSLPTKDREGKPMVFDSYDMSNVLFNEGKPLRNTWYYFTEAELSPGAVRVGHFKAVYNTRGDNGAQAGSDAPGQQLGWRGDETYVATVPAIYDIWQDPQERYDIFMTSFTEKTWTAILFNQAYADIMKSYVQYPPRPLQSETYTGPMEITRFRNLQEAKKLLESKGFQLPDDLKPKQ